MNANQWEGRSVEAAYREYYETLAGAAESGLFDIIGHPGNIAYFGFHPEDQVRLELEEAFLQHVTRLPIVLEINNGGLLRPAKELFPRPGMACRIGQLGIPVSTGSDAHRSEDVGHDFPNLYRQLRQWGFTEITGFAGRRRVTYPLAEMPLSIRAGVSS